MRRREAPSTGRMDKTVRLSRKKALGMDELVREYIRSMKLASGLNTQRIFAAWDAVSGAGRYTLRKFFRAGTLYVTVSSSVVREQLYFQKDTLISAINGRLREDELFTSDDPRVSFVRELKLK